jgi:chromate transport protein ChrA
MKVAGIPGAVLALAGFLMLPFVVVLVLSFLYGKYRSFSVVRNAFSVLNACIIAVLMSSAINLNVSSVFGGTLFGGKTDVLALIIFSLTVALSRATANQRRLAQYAALKDYEERMRRGSAALKDSEGTEAPGKCGAER